MIFSLIEDKQKKKKKKREKREIFYYPQSPTAFNPNLTTGFTGLVGKVWKKLSPKGGRKGGWRKKKRAQRTRRARGSNPGPAAC